MTKELEQRFHVLDGLAQKARNGELTMPEVNLALSVLLENELAFLNNLVSAEKSGVVGDIQSNVITERVRAKTPVLGVKTKKKK
jgi:hypothetical protein